MIRFLIAIIILIAAFFLFSNAERLQPVDPGAPVPPVDEPEEPVEPEDPIEPEDPVDPEAPEEPAEPADDVLTDENGSVFSYRAAGDLMPGSGQSDILIDDIVYDDTIVFPAEDAVFLNSQQYMHGGYFKDVNGKGPDQCNAENYAYPWRDNFCEKRGRNQYFCAQGGHTGVDVRAATCSNKTHWVIAPEPGRIVAIGTYGVRLMSDDGTWYQFLHMAMAELAVASGDTVVAGQRLGKISNVYFDGDGNMVPTTIHVHIDMKEAFAPSDGEDPFIDRVNPYMTFVAAYERKLRGE